MSFFCKIYFSPAAVHSLDVGVMGQNFMGGNQIGKSELLSLAFKIY